MSSVVDAIFISLFISFILSLSKSESTAGNDPSLFPGHLEPLGVKHKKSLIKTLFSFPDPSDFFLNFASASQPVLIKTGAKLSPAFDKWTDEYFLSLPEAESFTIEVENGKKENRTNGDVKRLSFKEFVEIYRNNDVYMVNGVPTFIQ